jgi:hypothetical protein
MYHVKLINKCQVRCSVVLNYEKYLRTKYIYKKATIVNKHIRCNHENKQHVVKQR